MNCAFRRNCRYGSVVVDLERRRPVALLPDREIATVAAWLSRHPSIAVVARDRGGGYGEATARALPHAVQVADRWRLMENASAAFFSAVRANMTPIRRALGATHIDPKLLTAAERLQYEGYQRRARADDVVLGMACDGLTIKAIVRRTALARGTVRRILRGEHSDVFRTRQSSLGAWLPILDAQWTEGCTNGAELWRRLRRQGFQGSLRVVAEWSTRRRRAEATERRSFARSSGRLPEKTIAKAMTTERDRLTKGAAILVASIEAAAPGKTASARASTPACGTQLLNGEISHSLAEAKAVLEGWRRHYNAVRPHASLGYRPPAPEVALWPAVQPRPVPPATPTVASAPVMN